ncbi:MAG: alpha/beta hydrolase [Alphaproteobacteria bacterium]|nr:alpha/beta hydrolase [Alphaproteobacteria bacterium]
MNIIFCDGVMPPEMDWNTREYYAGNWKHWLQFRVEKDHDVIMQIPKFPHAHALLMKYDEWENIMDFQDINPETVLIGHSAGGGFILKYLSTHPELKIKQAILVAPWIDTNNEQPNGFYDGFDLNNNMVKQTTCGIDMMISDDDMPDILSSTDKIAENITNIKVHKYKNRGHFLFSELPEILDIIKFNK